MAAERVPGKAPAMWFCMCARAYGVRSSAICLQSIRRLSHPGRGQPVVAGTAHHGDGHTGAVVRDVGLVLVVCTAACELAYLCPPGGGSRRKLHQPPSLQEEPRLRRDPSLGQEQ